MIDIHVDWEGPLSVDEAKTLSAPTDFGLYQYYGDHAVYGQGVLLYLGKAVEQTFGVRIAQHNWHLWVPGPTTVYVGRLCGPSAPGMDLWKQWIDLAERMLLFTHSPAFNAANLNRIGHSGEDVRVLNWGKRKSLLPEVTVSRWESGTTIGHVRPSTLAPFKQA